MEEIWKNIDGTNGEYQVSNIGNVRSLKKNKIRQLKIFDNGYGYLRVSLNINGKIKSEKVHRLVAKAFIPNPNDYPCINHIDENKYNNNVNNLEWCSYSYNNCYGKRIKKVVNKTSKKVFQYDKQGNFIREWNSAMEIQRELGYRANSICSCCNGKYKTSYNFIWKYKEK